MLSVIMPSLNAAAFIHQQLEALSSQTFRGDWELLIADNGSTDGTNAVVQAYRDKLPHIRLVNASCKQGSGAARNLAALEAKGELLLFCDADDVVGPNWISALAAGLEEYSLVGGYHQFFSTRMPPSEEPYRPVAPQPYLGLPATPWSCNMGLHRQLFEAVGGFDEDLLSHQDVELCWRLIDAGASLGFVEEAAIWKRRRTGWLNIFRQQVRYGFYDSILYARYRPAVRRESWKQVASSYGLVAYHLSLSMFPAHRNALARPLARRLGRLAGSIKTGTLFL